MLYNLLKKYFNIWKVEVGWRILQSGGGGGNKWGKLKMEVKHCGEMQMGEFLSGNYS